MNRRQLFDPRHAAHTAGQILGALDEASDADLSGPDEIALVRLGWWAMATGWQILVPMDVPDAVEAGQDAFELLDALEDQLTVYRDHSEVSRINRLAHQRPIRVEARLFDLFRLAEEINQATEGTFDITAGALIKAWGFFRGPRRVPSTEERAEAVQRVGMQHVELTTERRSIHYHRQGLEINLGAIGKGYALDRVVERLEKIPAALLHGGQSSVYAKGCSYGTGRGWRVRVRHPWIAGRYLAEVYLRNRALGTSAATFQYLEHEGKKLGHILDPRTGWPASGIASASVLAPTSALADALSTAFYVGGIELAQRYCAKHPEIGAILLSEGEREPVLINLNVTPP
jgi:thiamine biosynthesis lipoprotein